MTSLKRRPTSVFDALIVLAVLSDHMNVCIAKHIDLTMPFDGLIPEKLIIFLLIIPIYVRHSQPHGVHIYNFLEAAVILSFPSSYNQKTRGG